jgi:transcriptional regulator with XRE-family HTH domain
MSIAHKIRRIREIKNYSQEFVAQKLDISPKAYSKLENDETKLSVDRLYQIAEILEVKPEDLMNFDEKMIFYNINNHDNGIVVNKALSDGEKNAYEKLITHLQEEIVFLRKQLERN